MNLTGDREKSNHQDAPTTDLCYTWSVFHLMEQITMSAPIAFIFDLDGVITDTAEYHYRAWKRLADEEHIPFSREDNDQLRGVSRRQSLVFLLKDRVLPEAEMETWMIRKNDYYRAYLADVTPT